MVGRFQPRYHTGLLASRQVGESIIWMLQCAHTAALSDCLVSMPAGLFPSHTDVSLQPGGREHATVIESTVIKELCFIRERYIIPRL